MEDETDVYVFSDEEVLRPTLLGNFDVLASERKEANEAKAITKQLNVLKRKHGLKSVEVVKGKLAKRQFVERSRRADRASHLDEDATFQSTTPLTTSLLDLQESLDVAQQVLECGDAATRSRLENATKRLVTSATTLAPLLETLIREHDAASVRVKSFEQSVLQHSYRLTLANNPLLAEPVLVYGVDTTMSSPFQKPYHTTSANASKIRSSLGVDDSNLKKRAEGGGKKKKKKKASSTMDTLTSTKPTTTKKKKKKQPVVENAEV